MTSYQELTAEGEADPLFTGCCRANEVINRDLDGGSHPELCRRDEAGEQEVEVDSGFYSSHLTLCTSSDSPPPPPPSLPHHCETLEGFSTPACPHSSRIPWRCRAQGQVSLGRGYCWSNDDETRHCGFGSLTEQIQIKCSHDGPEIHAASSDCDGAETEERSKTFEWMRVKRSPHRAGKFLSTELGRRDTDIKRHCLHLFKINPIGECFL